MNTSIRILITISTLLVTVHVSTSQQPQATSDTTWHYRFSYTKSVNSQFNIDCEQNDQIWIGWSHYGTRHNLAAVASVPSIKNSFPSENDCWMNFTEKIAEQCNGASQCELSSQPTYIHKCGKTSDYLYVAYQCIRQRDTFDICKAGTHSFSAQQHSALYLKSSDFPDEYSSSLDCSCVLTQRSSSISSNFKLDMLWFSLQDNDFLSVMGQNLTGWVNPTHEIPVTSRVSLIRFVTDDALAYKGFWFKLARRRVCKDDWQLVGDSCIKVISDNLSWRAANQRCQQMNGHLIMIDDVVSDLKLTQYMKRNYAEISAYWIGLRKYADQHNQEKWMWSNNSTAYSDVSWWPWRKQNSTDTGSANHCVLKRRNEDGYFTTLCDAKNRNSFICQTEPLPTVGAGESSADLLELKCGATEEIQKHYEAALIDDAAAAAAATVSKSKFQTIGSSSELAINKFLVPISQDLPPSSKVLTKTTATAATAASSITTPTTSATSSPPSFTPLLHLFNVAHNLGGTGNVVYAAKHNKDSSRINTAILAGIISGIGLVIVIINLAVLFMCRRNLKKLLKTSKDANRPASSHDDIIQEYFEAFNTMHNQFNATKKSPIAANNTLGVNTMLHSPPALHHHNHHHPPHHLNLPTSTIKAGGGGKASDILTIPREHLLQLQQHLSSSSIIDESAHLFFNPTQQHNHHHHHHQMSRETMARQSSSAFKPFTRDDQQHLLTMQKQTLDMQRQLLLAKQQLHEMQGDGNQYDKINHHPLQLSHSMLKHSAHKAAAATVMPDETDAAQYAHTYETLDTLDMPSGRQRQITAGTLVHLGVNGRNYRTVMNANELLLAHAAMLSANQISPDSAANDSTGTTNFNLSTSSSSSSSGTSSTHQLLKGANFNNDAINLQQHAQIMTQIMNNSNNPNINSAVLSVSGGGAWSPDSAYYSSIPNLNPNLNFSLVHTNGVTLNGGNGAHFILNSAESNNHSNNNENFKSHLV